MIAGSCLCDVLKEILFDLVLIMHLHVCVCVWGAHCPKFAVALKEIETVTEIMRCTALMADKVQLLASAESVVPSENLKRHAVKKTVEEAGTCC